MDPLCYFFLVSVMLSQLSVYWCLVVTCWERVTSWLSFVMSYCVFATFPCGIPGQVWYLIVLIPDLCPLSYFYKTEHRPRNETMFFGVCDQLTLKQACSATETN